MPTNNRANQLNPNNPAFDPVLAAATKQLSPGNPAAYHQAQVYRPKNESLHIESISKAVENAVRKVAGEKSNIQKDGSIGKGTDFRTLHLLITGHHVTEVDRKRLTEEFRQSPLFIGAREERRGGRSIHTLTTLEGLKVDVAPGSAEYSRGRRGREGRREREYLQREYHTSDQEGARSSSSSSNSSSSSSYNSNSNSYSSTNKGSNAAAGDDIICEFGWGGQENTGISTGISKGKGDDSSVLDEGGGDETACF